jgi:hypothetical protein
MSWLVLASEVDEAARWAAGRLPGAGLEPLRFVTDAELAGATWDHRLDDDGVATTLTLTDGRVIRSSEVKGTLNRLVQVPAGLITALAPADRDYAFHEFSALFMSWLASLPGPILNPPETRGLGGAWRSPAEWAMLAAESGVRSARVSFDSANEWPYAGGWRAWPPYAPIEEDVIVVGEAVFARDPVDAATLAAYRRLARRAGTPILGIAFACATCGGSQDVVAVSPLPDLRAGGDELIEALAAALRGDGKVP